MSPNKLKAILDSIEKNLSNVTMPYPEPNPNPVLQAGEPTYSKAVQDDLQGNLLPGFNATYQSFLFLKFGTRAKAKAFLGSIAPLVSSTRDVREFRAMDRSARARTGSSTPVMAAVWMNVAFSYTGIQMLTSKSEANKFGDESFKLGMSERSYFLGDPTDSNNAGHKSQWAFGGENNFVDMMCTIASKSSDLLAEFEQQIQEMAAQYNVTLVHRQPAANLPGPLAGHEHFGFKDGISQPGLRGKYTRNELITPRYLDNSDTRHDYNGKPGQLLVWPGQFLLGEPRQSTEAYKNKDSNKQANFPSWAKKGSYLVVRRLSQDVPAFWKFVERESNKVGVNVVEFASRLVGRWPSGAPLIWAPKKDNPKLGANALENNNFIFDDKSKQALMSDPNFISGTANEASADFLAKVCPHFSHIRKVNPRDSVTDLGKPDDNLARMILRRGIPFGETLFGKNRITQEDMAKERGLMFVCYNTNIEEQFEFLQRRWSNSLAQPNFGGHDPIIGQNGEPGRLREIDFPIKNGTKKVKIKEDFITPTGGEYFFVPTISALKDTLAN